MKNFFTILAFWIITIASFGSLAQTPDINVKYSSFTIPNNAGVNNNYGTIFSSVPVSNVAINAEYTIQNLGSGTLTISSINITGTEAGDFTVSNSPSTTLASNATTTLRITFNPSASGRRTASVVINNNDPDENPFRINLLGFGIEPEMDVFGNGNPIANGSSTPITNNHTHFGAEFVTGGSIVRTFTIENNNLAALNLTGTPKVAISGTHASDFSLTSAPVAIVQRNESTTFQITFNPSGSGVRTALLTIANDDEDERPYTFAIEGVGTVPSSSADYTISTANNTITITDVNDNGETMEISESNSNIRFFVSGRTYSIDGGAVTPFTTPADIPISGNTGIVVNTNAGNDIITVGAFTSALPSLTINAGGGDDIVNMNGNITFAANANLDLDLQNDDASPSRDVVNIGTNVNVILAGTGSATIKVSQNVFVNTGGGLTTANGNLLVEANQQGTPTSGNFAGVRLDGLNSLFQVTGSGLLTVKGKGGDIGSITYGIYMGRGGKIIGGTNTVTVEGIGGPTSSFGSYGVGMIALSEITSTGGNIIINGTGNGTAINSGGIGLGYDGVYVRGTISAGGTGNVTITGRASLNDAEESLNGFRIIEGRVMTAGGNITINGYGGGSGNTPRSIGISISSGVTMSPGGMGTLTLNGEGGVGTGNGNHGIVLFGVITSGGGNIIVTGKEGGGIVSYGVVISNTIYGGADGEINTSTNGGDILLRANSFASEANTLTLITGHSSNKVTFLPLTNTGVGINFVSTSDVVGGPITISDFEFDNITGGAFYFGNANTGAINVNEAISHAAGNIYLTTGQALNLNQSFGAGTGNIIINAAGGINPKSTTVDLSGNAISFTSGNNLTIAIGGTTVNTEYDQLNIQGAIDLTGLNLVLSGSYVPVAGNTFTIVNNDGTDAITGKFNNLDQGATIPNFRGSGLNATISYTGGSDNNDVVITVASAAAAEINVKGNNQTIVSGDNTPIITDHTDFGPVSVPSGSVTRTFTIENPNTATAALVLGTITGGTTDFVITQPNLTTIPVGGSTTFTVVFDPTVAGKRTATISIPNNDPDENPYTFAIEGYGGTPFITTWKTDNAGTSNSTSIRIPTTGTGYNYDVDWNNDGTFDEFGLTGSVTHNYGTAGTYTVAIRGSFPRIYFNNGGDKSKLLNVTQWGDIAWTSMGYAFTGCNNLNVTATDVPNLALVTDVSYMFSGCANLSGPSNIGTWDVSGVITMAGMFNGATIFNQNISGWDVRNVTNMSYMFAATTLFNQTITGWNVGNVTNMSFMFYLARDFNQNINVWDVSKVTNMERMFREATSFTQSLNSWVVGSVTNMSYMFWGATAFNGNIGAWDVSKVTDMSLLFYGASSFNQDISNWKVGAVTTMDGMFYGATSFNQNIGGWNVGAVTTMANMFRAAVAFNQDIGNWNVSAVQDMSLQFYGTRVFNQDLSRWRVNAVQNMRLMFYDATAFNGNLSTWDVSAVTNMSYMFSGATVFNQSLAAWGTKLNAAVDLSNMLDNCGMSVVNYDATLTGFNAGTVTTKALGAAGLQYCSSKAHRDNLVLAVGSGGKGWIITGDVLSCPTTLTLGTATNPTTCGGTGNITFTSTGIAVGSQTLTYKKNTVAATTTVTVAANGSFTLSGLGAGVYSDFAIGATTATGSRSLNLPASCSFITTWKTDNAGTSNSTSITIPTTGTGYNYDVDWNNDGTFDEFGKTGSVTHDYGVAGTYQVAIRGLFPRIYFNDTDDARKILSIDQWGSIDWKSMAKAFDGCSNVEVNASDTPDLNDVTNMSVMFNGIKAINQNITGWDVSQVTDMSNLFSGITSFNQNLSSWQVGNVTNMGSMFLGTAFNQDISNWDVSKVTDMSIMFALSPFNQNISGWDVSKVTDMTGMFSNATAFNQSLAAWGTKFNANVNLTEMLSNCGMSIANYDATLIGFNTGTVTSRVLGATGLKYCASAAARTNLIDTKGWTISGDASASPATPTASVTVQPTCTTPQGTIVVTAPVGGDIQYSVGGLYQTSGTFSGLNPNTYTVTAKNTTTGCISSGLSLTVNSVPSAPATPTASVTIQPTCTTPQGTIVVTAPTGGDIQYSVGNTYQTSGTFSGLNPGSYTVTAKNTTTGCISSGLSLTVNSVPSAPATPTASVTIQPTCTTPQGTIVVTAPVGGDIQYSVGNTYQVSGTFSGLNPNTYTVTAKNTTTGCISSGLSLTVNSVPSAPATPTASVTVQPTCTTQTGTIVVTAPVGGDIQYSIGGLYQVSGTFSGLEPGLYTVTAKNTTTGCISSGLSLTVNSVPSAPATPTASVTVQPTCTTPQGTIVVTAPVGGDIQYSVGGLYQTSGTFSGLIPNTYTVTAKNTTTGCISSGLLLTVNSVPSAPATPTASVTVQPTCTTPQGTIVVTAPMGGDIQYSVGGLYQTSGTFSGLIPNTYTVTAKNTTTGCISSGLSLTVNLVPSAPATPTASVTVQPTCTTQTGTIVVTAPVGGDIQYSVGGLYQTSGTFSGLTPNTYTVTAKNTTTGCISSGLSLTVNSVPSAPATPTASVTVQPTCTTPQGTIVVTAPVGGDIQYSVGGLYQTSGTFSGLNPNTYTVTAKNMTTGCISSGLLLTVNTVPSALTITPGTSSPICAGATSFTIPYTVVTGTPTTYSISGAGITTVTNGVLTNPIVVNLSNPASGNAISYTLTVGNASGCVSGTITGSVTVVGPPTISLTTLQQTLNEGNNPVLCDTDANPVNSLQFSTTTGCLVGTPVWRVQVGSGAWSIWSSTAPVSQSSNKQPHRYQAACDANCASTYSGVIELTINYRASTPQNVSLLVDGVTVKEGETKEICGGLTTNLTFNASCAAGEVILYSVDGGEYSSVVPTSLVDNQFHNYRVRCRKSDGTPSCVESESGVMRLKIVTIPSAPTVSLSSTGSCTSTTVFSGQSSCGSLQTIWYNATTNVALPNLPTNFPVETTSYYARCQTSNGCLSEKSNVVTYTVTATYVAPVITASQEIVCTGTTVTISANCPAGSQTFWNTGVTTPSFEVAFNNVTKQTYWAKCIFDGGCQSSESVRKDIYWNAFVVTMINVGQSKSAVKPANDKALWSSQFITKDGGPELEQSTQGNPTLYYVENVNKVAPRYWTINVEACGLSTDGSLTFDLLATPETGVPQSFNTHENNAPYFMYANREGWTELYAQNHPAYGFYQDNGAGGNVYDTGLPKGLYKLSIRYWDMKGWGSIYPATRQPQGNVLAYQEYWFRVQSKDGVGVGAARTADSGEQSAIRGLFVLPNPVTNILRLQVSDSKGQVVQTELTDASGRSVLRRQFTPETNSHQEEFDVSELANGMYFLRVDSKEKVRTLKVIKVN